jgi:hypothetical protein
MPTPKPAFSINFLVLSFKWSSVSTSISPFSKTETSRFRRSPFRGKITNNDGGDAIGDILIDGVDAVPANSSSKVNSFSAPLEVDFEDSGKQDFKR